MLYNLEGQQDIYYSDFFFLQFSCLQDDNHIIKNDNVYLSNA